MDVRWICITAGSPYYNPHMQRPAIFPPLDGYLPPEDPLRGVARQIEATARLKAALPRAGDRRLGLQLPAGVAAERRPSTRSRNGMTDFVGLGRMVLAIRTCRPTCWRRRRCSREVDLPHVQRLHDRAAHWAWCRAAIRSTRSTWPSLRPPTILKKRPKADE